jgi:osmotically-inducible protein OsmY
VPNLQRDVLDELLWDPSISPANVEVSANNSVVTLSGSIGSYTEKYAREHDARRVCGVLSVSDERLSISVNDGLLTLMGAVAYQFQPEEAHRGGALCGAIKGVNDQMRIVPFAQAGELKEHVEKELADECPQHPPGGLRLPCSSRELTRFEEPGCDGARNDRNS